MVTKRDYNLLEDEAVVTPQSLKIENFICSIRLLLLFQNVHYLQLDNIITFFL